MVPISLFAYIIETRVVFGVRARATSSGFTNPSLSTSRYVTLNPSFSSCLNGSVTEECSIFVVIKWLPLSLFALAVPKIARLFASVAVPQKITSLDRQFRNFAIVSRASSTAIKASLPFSCRDSGFPYFSEKYGSIAFRTFGSKGVVEA